MCQPEGEGSALRGTGRRGGGGGVVYNSVAVLCPWLWSTCGCGPVVACDCGPVVDAVCRLWLVPLFWKWRNLMVDVACYSVLKMA